MDDLQLVTGLTDRFKNGGCKQFLPLKDKMNNDSGRYSENSTSDNQLEGSNVAVGSNSIAWSEPMGSELDGLSNEYYSQLRMLNEAFPLTRYEDVETNCRYCGGGTGTHTDSCPGRTFQNEMDRIISDKEDGSAKEGEE